MVRGDGSLCLFARVVTGYDEGGDAGRVHKATGVRWFGGHRLDRFGFLFNLARGFPTTYTPEREVMERAARASITEEDD